MSCAQPIPAISIPAINKKTRERRFIPNMVTIHRDSAWPDAAPAVLWTLFLPNPQVKVNGPSGRTSVPAPLAVGPHAESQFRREPDQRCSRRGVFGATCNQNGSG